MANTQTITETWNGYVNQSAQQFVTGMRQDGFTTVETMVDAYVEQLPSMATNWSPEDREAFEQEREDIRVSLVAYLERTHGEEWQ